MYVLSPKTKRAPKDQSIPELLSAPPFSPPSVTLPFPCTSRGHVMCFICKRPGPKLVVVDVDVDVRHHTFLSKEIIIPAWSRCCSNRLQQNIHDINPLAKTTTFNKTSQLIQFLRSEVMRIEKKNKAGF